MNQESIFRYVAAYSPYPGNILYDTRKLSPHFTLFVKTINTRAHNKFISVNN